LQPFVIPISGLTQGSTSFEWRADKEFFGRFENSEILDADLDVHAVVRKKGAEISLDCDIRGTVTVLCDRCTEDLQLPVQTSFDLEFDSSEDVWDISQDVYDFVNIALPMQRVHPEGECNPDTIKYISDESTEPSEGPMDNPFAALKELLNDK